MGMEGMMLEKGLDNQMGRLTLSSEDISNKNRENGSPYDNKVKVFFSGAEPEPVEPKFFETWSRRRS